MSKNGKGFSCPRCGNGKANRRFCPTCGWNAKATMKKAIKKIAVVTKKIHIPLMKGKWFDRRG